MSTYSVTSAFIAESRKTHPLPIVRKFTLAGSDYSSWIEKWPKFTVRWDEVRPKSLYLKLNNANQDFNFLRDDKTLLQGAATLAMGFTFVGSGDETIDLFAGTVRGIRYRAGTCELAIVDKFQQLSDRKMGETDNPVNYGGSSYLPSDIAWWAITSYGGFDTTADSSNTDIDYESFAAWAAVFSGDAVGARANFTGQKITEVLRKIARTTHSAIFVKNNKVSFHRFSIADTAVFSLGGDQVHEVKLSFDVDDITNRQWVSGHFRVGSSHRITTYADDTASINSYGLKENYVKDENFWLRNSDDCTNLAERLVLSNASPDDKLEVRAGLAGMPTTVGETVYIQDTLMGVSESYRILEHTINMDDGTTMMRGDRRQLSQYFILDTSSLGSTTDILT